MKDSVRERVRRIAKEEIGIAVRAIATAIADGFAAPPYSSGATPTPEPEPCPEPGFATEPYFVTDGGQALRYCGPHEFTGFWVKLPDGALAVSSSALVSPWEPGESDDVRLERCPSMAGYVKSIRVQPDGRAAYLVIWKAGGNGEYALGELRPYSFGPEDKP